MFSLTVLYDPECGLCRRAHEWLEPGSSRVMTEMIAGYSVCLLLKISVDREKAA